MPENPDPPIGELMDRMVAEARSIAWKHWHGAPYVLEFDELLALAYKGLAEAHARWGLYCEKNSYDPATTRYFSEYCRRRINGSILDYKRAQDWVPRAIRNNARVLRDAGQDQGQSEAQMAASTGLSRAEVSQTLAAMAQRPVGFDPVEHDVADRADTESHVAASALMDAAVSALEDQPVAVQFTTVLTFYCGMTPREAGEVLGMEAAEVATLAQQGALAAHRALAMAAGEIAG